MLLNGGGKVEHKGIDYELYFTSHLDHSVSSDHRDREK